MGSLTHLPLKHSKSPMRIHVPSNACDIISFYGQRQLCHLTVQGEEIFQTKPNQNEHTLVNKAQRKRQKKKKLTLTQKLP